MYPDDNNYDGFHREQNKPSDEGGLPPVEPRYSDMMHQEPSGQSEYDDSYNYTEKKRKSKPKKAKKRNIAGVMAALCVASAVGGSLLTGYVVLPAIYGEYNLQQSVSTAGEPTVVSSNVEDQSSSLGGAAPIISDTSNPVPEIAEKVSTSVVGVKTYNKEFVPGEQAQTQDVGYGTGFVVSSDGYIVTNSHVVESGDYVQVVLADGTEYEATIQGRDYDSDVAVLKIDATGLTPVSIGDSDGLEVGEMVVAIGNPLGEELAGTVTVGYLSSLNREIQSGDRTYHVLQTDAAINPGNSGGPLFDVNGQVIGVTTLKSMFAGVDEYGETIASEGIGFAMPINYVMNIAEELIANGSIEKPGIGISYYMMTEEDATNWEAPMGALVVSVTEGGPAAKAGVQQNDVITAVDGVAVADIENLADTVKEKGLDATVTLTVWRNGENVDIQIVTEDINKLTNSTATSQNTFEFSNPFSENGEN